ncbi:hypothetical protein B296_00023222 [Ensete ventricosum]|uniref:Uncharacterized protein n=1 Tax=Ensete ventricosum TaxID=4639 RepID=A0A426ZVJ7_ENSVE|nr:hypothetical protein B296_00023222 [Ensete ventricosum]
MGATGSNSLLLTVVITPIRRPLSMEVDKISSNSLLWTIVHEGQQALSSPRNKIFSSFCVEDAVEENHRSQLDLSNRREISPAFKRKRVALAVGVDPI